MSFRDRELFFYLEEGSESLDMDMLQHMHPALVLMIGFTNLWCYSNNIKPVWTSWMRTPEQNRALGATDVHVYRGADLSDKKKHGWNPSKRQVFERDFRSMFKNVGAYSRSDGGKLMRMPLVRHDSGHGGHYHMQVHPNATIDGIRAMKPMGIKLRRGKRVKDESN